MKLSRIQKLIYYLTPNFLLRRFLPFFKDFSFLIDTDYISFSIWYRQQVLGFSEGPYWPVHPTSTVIEPGNVYCGKGTCPGYSPGNYIQAIGKIHFGDYTQIAANVGIISSNHNLYDSREHLPTTIKVGSYCWIGFGAVILPEVELGDFTIVGAGSVVTKSFKDGYCVIAGNPARKIKDLIKEECIKYGFKTEYNGYIRSDKFESFRKKNLNV